MLLEDSRDQHSRGESRNQKTPKKSRAPNGPAREPSIGLKDSLIFQTPLAAEEDQANQAAAQQQHRGGQGDGSSAVEGKVVDALRHVLIPRGG